jgi:two-component system sensor histidine kinase ChiS
MPIVLIVEDDPANRELMAEQLTSHHLTPVTCSNGIEALKWLSQHTADVAVVDLALPGINGYEICRRVRQTYSKQALPIIVVTALGPSADMEDEAFRAGANAFLARPYQEEELIIEIQRHLNPTNP